MSGNTYTPDDPAPEFISLNGINVDTPEGAAQALEAWMRGDTMVLRVKRGDGTYVYPIDECMIGGAQ